MRITHRMWRTANGAWRLEDAHGFLVGTLDGARPQVFRNAIVRLRTENPAAIGGFFPSVGSDEGQRDLDAVEYRILDAANPSDRHRLVRAHVEGHARYPGGSQGNPYQGQGGAARMWLDGWQRARDLAYGVPNPPSTELDSVDCVG